MEKNYITVPFDDKDLAKQLGARWDGEKKSWYYYDKSQLSKIKSWYPPKVEKVFKRVEIPQKITFFTGEEILNYLGFQRSQIEFAKDGFCGMCDSHISNEWVSGKVHFEHCGGDVWEKWQNLTKTEKAILYHYLYITEPCKTNEIESSYKHMIKFLFE